MRLAAVLAVSLLAAGCGYRAGGQGDLLPKTAKTVAIPAFTNVTTRYRLTDRMASALSREFIARTRYQVVPDEGEADLVLRGAVLNYMAFPNVLNTVEGQQGRASGVQVTAMFQVSLIDRATGKVVYNRPYFEFRQRYEISADQLQYFEESETALDRLSRDVARTVVSAVLEAF